ncbi:MAG: hypothetical protein JXR25_13790 [Pontiellaceae bacterium]|nr:hypothetical protein [Pontiellaceae bacterium]
MKRIICTLPLLACIGGIGIIVAAVIESHEKQTEPAFIDRPTAEVAMVPDADTFTQQDRELVQQVFDNPQVMDDTSSQHPTVSSLVVRPENGSTMSSAGNNSSMNIERSAETIAVPTENLESFASLRTDAVRNPESEQNQAAAKEIMKMRQRRVEQLANRGER